MIDWILKPLLIVALAALCCLFTKRAALRHLYWTLAFAGLLLLRILPEQAVVQAPIPAAWVSVAAANSDPATDNTTVYTAPSRGKRAPKPYERVELVVRMFWLMGVFACWARFAQGLWSAYQITAAATPTASHGHTRIYETHEHSIPFTWGCLRPAILLPGEAQQWTEARRQHVLAHEFAHIQRADWLTQTVAQLLCGVYWFHPAVWYASARMRRESEGACDDAVVRSGNVAEEYAEDLLHLAKQDTKQHQPPLASVAMWSRSQLEDRIMRILNNPDRRGVSRLAGVALSIATVLALAPLASVTVLAQSTITYEGNVSDPSGARVPGVNIRVMEGKNTLTSTVSGADGSYKLSFPMPDSSSKMPLLLIAEQPGFAVASYPLGGFGNRREFVRDIALNLGQIRENIAVEGVRPSTPRPVAGGPPQRIRVGGNVQAANLISKTNPEYPKELQEKGIEGTVELEAIISKEGNMLSVHPRSRNVDQGLIDAATKAVQTWQYRPVLLNGQPVEVVTTVTVRFYLK